MTTPWIQIPPSHDGRCDCPGFPAVSTKHNAKKFMAKGWHMIEYGHKAIHATAAGPPTAIERCPAYWRKVPVGKKNIKLEIDPKARFPDYAERQCLRYAGSASDPDGEIRKTGRRSP